MGYFKNKEKAQVDLTGTAELKKTFQLRGVDLILVLMLQQKSILNLFFNWVSLNPENPIHLE